MLSADGSTISALPPGSGMRRDHPDLSELEAVTDCGGAVL
jgi:hypothetical protein